MPKPKNLDSVTFVPKGEKVIAIRTFTGAPAETRFGTSVKIKAGTVGVVEDHLPAVSNKEGRPSDPLMCVLFEHPVGLVSMAVRLDAVRPD